MKKILIVLLLGSSTLIFAGTGHKHNGAHGHSHAPKMQNITKEKTGVIGRSHIQRLVKAGKIDKTWKESTFTGSVKKKFSGQTEWVVTFDNVKGVKGKKLYIFLKLSGDFIAANFTGK